MTKLFRDFPPQQVRAGGRHMKNVYTLRCYKCPETEDIESNVNLPDQVISKKFHQHGWTIGTKRTSDLCPVCSGTRKPVDKVAETLAEKFSVILDGEKVEKKVKQPLEIQIKKRHALNGTTAHTPVPDAEDMPPLETKPQVFSDLSLAPVLRELADMRAALELQMEMMHSMLEKFNTIKSVEVEAPQPPAPKVWDAPAVREFFEENEVVPAIVDQKTYPGETFFMVHVTPTDMPVSFDLAERLMEIVPGVTVVIRKAEAIADSVHPDNVRAAHEALQPKVPSIDSLTPATEKGKKVLRRRTKFFEEVADIIRKAGKPVHISKIWEQVSDEAKDGIPYKKASARLVGKPKIFVFHNDGWDLVSRLTEPNRAVQSSMEARKSRILEQGERTGWSETK